MPHEAHDTSAFCTRNKEAHRGQSEPSDGGRAGPSPALRGPSRAMGPLWNLEGGGQAAGGDGQLHLVDQLDHMHKVLQVAAEQWLLAGWGEEQLHLVDQLNQMHKVL